MKNFVLTLAMIVACTSLASSQTMEELKAQRAEKEAQVSEIKGEIADLNAQIAKIPGWRKGSSGTIGFNLANFNNWVTQANPNSTATTILASFNGFTNLIEEEFFWRNSGNLALGWQKLEVDKTDPASDAGFEQTTDVIQITSLYGRNLRPKLAASALGEFRSTVLNNAFNPAYLDLGVGFTWTPVTPLVVVIHPLNYNFVIAKEDAGYQSSAGAKLVADYNQEVLPGVKFRSNLTSFISYKSSDLSNFTWTSGLSFTAFSGIGVGLEYAVRQNKQETRAAEVEKDGQNYFILGLTYNL